MQCSDFYTPLTAAIQPKFWARDLKISLKPPKKIADLIPSVFRVPPRGPILPPLDKKNLPKTGFEPATFKLQHDILLWALAKLFVYKTKKNRNLKLHWWLKSCILDSILRLDSFLRDRWEIYDLWSVGEFLFLFWAVERQLSLPNQTINYFWSFERQTLLTAHSCFYPSLNLLWAVGKNDNFCIFSHRS